MVQYCLQNELEGNAEIWYFRETHGSGRVKSISVEILFYWRWMLSREQRRNRFPVLLVWGISFWSIVREKEGTSIKHLSKQSASNYGNTRSRLWLLVDAFPRYVIQFWFKVECTRLEKFNFQVDFREPFKTTLWWFVSFSNFWWLYYLFKGRRH